MNEPKSPDETDLRAERDRLRAELEERQKADAGKKLANEVALMRLESRFTKELGARGVHFDIVDATHLDEGFIVVGLGPSVLHKRFIASKGDEEDVAEFVEPNVKYPDKDKYLEIAHRRPGLVHQAAHKLLSLYGLKAKEVSGKA